MKYPAFCFAVGLSFLLCPDAAHAQAMRKGIVEVVQKSGDVRMLLADGTMNTLHKGDVFGDGAIVLAGTDGHVLLAFSNGAALKLDPNAQLEIKNFKQASFDEKAAGGTFLALTQDPSKSTTELNLINGTLQGEIKNLDEAAGSKFTVDTPAGSAGIGGTVISLSVVRDSATSRVTSIIANCLVGAITFTPHLVRTDAGPATKSTSPIVQETPAVNPTGASVIVPARGQLQVMLEVNPTTGTIPGVELGGAVLSTPTCGQLLSAIFQTINASQGIISINPVTFGPGPMPPVPPPPTNWPPAPNLGGSITITPVAAVPPVPATPPAPNPPTPAAPLPPDFYSPAVLPGNGLNQHPFFYTGQYNFPKPVQTMFIVRDGKAVWSYDIPTNDASKTLQELSDATLLSNGNVVFARKTGAGEVTPDKKLIWNYDAPKGFEVHIAQPIGLDRVMMVQNGIPATLRIINIVTGKTEKEFELPTNGDPKTVHTQFRRVQMTKAGTFLAACHDQDKVVEFDANGKEIWSVAVPVPWDAVRLDNGDTLIASHNGFAREVNPKGETVWEFNQKDAPDITLFCIQEANRLANGNTVMSNWCPNAVLDAKGAKDPKKWPDTVQVLEVTPDKKVVWALRSWSAPADLGPATVIQLLDEPGIPENQEQQR